MLLLLKWIFTESITIDSYNVIRDEKYQYSNLFAWIELQRESAKKSTVCFIVMDSKRRRYFYCLLVAFGKWILDRKKLDWDSAEKRNPVLREKFIFRLCSANRGSINFKINTVRNRGFVFGVWQVNTTSMPQ